MTSGIINRLEALPLAGLVRTTDRKDGDFTVCECPFCKGERHFRISTLRRGSRDEWQEWRCPATGREGRGALSLYSAMRYRSLVGRELRLSVSELAAREGIHVPELDMPSSSEVEAVSEKARVQLSTTFSRECLLSLGFGDIISSPEDEAFLSRRLQEDFRLFPVVTYQSAPVRKGELQRASLVRSLPWSPMVALFTDDTHRRGRMFFPMERDRDFFFSLDKKESSSAMARLLCGSPVLSRVRDGMDVPSAVEECATGESFETTRRIWQEDENGSMRRVAEPVPPGEVRVAQCVFCDDPLDAVTAYFHLNFRTMRDVAPASVFYHTAFLLSPQTVLSRTHADFLQRFADRVFYSSSATEEARERAYRAGKRFRFLRVAEMPDGFPDIRHLSHTEALSEKPSSLAHFFLTYRLTPHQRYNFSSLTGLYRAALAAAVEIDPFEYEEKRDRKGHLQDYFYRLKPPSVWAFMRSEGYCRDVDEDSPDKIGRFVRVEKPFAEEMDVRSLLMRTQQMLMRYAEQISRPGTDDYEKMVTAILTDRTVNEKTAASLPSVHLDYRSGYGRDIDHFFYLNGALRITPDGISLIPYENLDFHVDKAEVLPWSFTMPVAEGEMPPVSILENPLYREKRECLEEHRKDGSFSVSDIAEEQERLMQWAQANRWEVDFHDIPENRRWPVLRVLRGFANENWEMEEQLARNGESLPEKEARELDARMANIFFGIGRVLWRYRTSASNCIPYLLENKVEKETKAEGGSGKSVLVNTFCACAGKVYRIDCRSKHSLDDLNREMCGFTPHCHRIIHWEDLDKPVDFLYNYATGDTTVKRMYAENLKIPLSESPGHIVSSNLALSSDSDSTVGRICTIGFSHRFARCNVLKNKPARLISDVFPDFNTDAQTMPEEMRNQIAYVCALAVQFVMRYDERVDAPQGDVRLRTMNRSFGESFVEWSSVFFGERYAYHIPYDISALFRQYRDFAEGAEGKRDLYSPRLFKERLKEYCALSSILMNPSCCYKEADSVDMRRSRLRRRCWTVRTYFEDRKIWSDRPRKDIWEVDDNCQTGVFFTKKEDCPKNYDEFDRICRKSVEGVFPNPFRDAEDNPVYLTPEEHADWENYVSRGQRRFYGASPDTPQTSSEPLPF